MNKEMISNRQAIALIILFMMGEGSIFVQGISAKRDIWLALIIAFAFALPMVMVYARLLSLYPNRNLFEIIELCLGKYLGKVLMALYIWFAFYEILSASNDLSYFVTTSSLPETPRLAIIAVFILACAYTVKNGIEVMGRWAELFLLIPIILVVVVALLLIPQIHFQNFLPVMYNGSAPVLKGAFYIFGFPLTYIVSFTMILSLSPPRNSAYKIFRTGLWSGSLILLVIYSLIMSVLGDYMATQFYYPSYQVVSMINIGGFLQRLDIIASIIYLVGIFIQISVFILATCKGVSTIFKCSDYRFLVLPMALLAIDASINNSDSVMHFFKFSVDTWAYYALPYEVFFPLLLWLVAEIKGKLKQRKTASANEPSENAGSMVEN